MARLGRPAGAALDWGRFVNRFTSPTASPAPRAAPAPRSPQMPEPTTAPEGAALPERRPARPYDADVIVVGAGPAGSSAAYHLATAGLDVLLLEKTAFPREKVCGDGLTPRAVKAADRHGHRHQPRGRLAAQQGPAHRRRRPPPASCPGPTSRRSRRTAWCARATTSTRSSPAPRRRPAPGCTSAPTSPARCSTAPAASPASPPAPPTRTARRGREQTLTAPRSCSPPTATPRRLSLAMGLRTREDRPMGVAVRTYYTSPRHDDDWLESWLELWTADESGKQSLLPGLRLDLRRRRRHGQRRPRHPQHEHGLPERRLQGPAQALAGPDARGVGLPRREHDPAGPRRRPADGLQPHSRTTPAACCSSATPAAWSTRSTARASPTRWSPAGSPPTSSPRRWPARRPTPRERALHRLPGHPQGRLRRLLHARPGVREAHRRPARHAVRHEVRPAAPDPDALHPEAAGQPHRPPRTATRWTA